jgi:parallel beta-helix repeat protein
MNRTHAAVGLGIAFVCVGVMAVAGPLNPPVGPVAPTAKPLSEVEPRTALSQSQVPITISQPGSYYLTGNLFAPALVTAIITVNVPGVTLDLNGFQIDGATDVGEATHAIKINAVAVRCRVLGGSVIDATGNGIDSAAPDGVFADLVCANCTLDGLHITGAATVERCVFRGNGGDGLDSISLERCVVRGCIAKDNGGTGFEVSGTFEACVASGNGGSGFLGSGTITRCEASQNAGFGINLVGGLVSECSVGANTDGGIRVADNASVTRCTVRLNSGPGIILSWRGLALDNNCSQNGGSIVSAQPNILVLGNNNRIEGNTCTYADRGIAVDGTGNLIIRNSCSGNTTNWAIVASNKVGPIVAAPNSVAISGDTGGAGVGSTNPWANITY